MSSRVSKIDRSLVDSLTASIFWMLNYENTSYPWRTQTIGKHWRPRVWRVSWRIDHAQATCSFSFNQKKFSLAISQIGLYWKWQTFMKHIHLQQSIENSIGSFVWKDTPTTSRRQNIFCINFRLQIILSWKFLLIFQINIIFEFSVQWVNNSFTFFSREIVHIV